VYLEASRSLARFDSILLGSGKASIAPHQKPEIFCFVFVLHTVNKRQGGRGKKKGRERALSSRCTIRGTGNHLRLHVGAMYGGQTGMLTLASWRFLSSKDRNSGFPEDSNRGLPKDSNRGLPEDSNRGLPTDSNRGLPKDRNSGLPEDRNSVPKDRNSGHAVGVCMFIAASPSPISSPWRSGGGSAASRLSTTSTVPL